DAAGDRYSCGITVEGRRAARQAKKRKGRQQNEHADAHGGEKCLCEDESIRHDLLAHSFAVDDDDGFVTDRTDGILVKAEVAAFQS
ncbi:MAG: hypothetical protein RLZZ232_3040, partial [Planctomycetota bacterium]